MQGLGPPKTLKNLRFFKVFVNAGFRYFEALGGPLGPILAPLGPIWSQEGSQNRSPNGSKWPTRGTGSAWRSSLRSSCFQDGSKMAPRWLNIGSRWPQVVQDSLLGTFLGLQTLSWKALDPQKPVKTNGLMFALPLLCLRFALVSPLLYLPFSF